MYTDRLHRIWEIMEEEQLDALVLSSTYNLFYLTGCMQNPHDRLNALILTEDDCHLVCHHLAVIADDVYPPVLYRDVHKVPALLAEYLTGKRRIGIDGSMPGRFLLPLMDLLPDSRFVASRAAETARMIKDEEEIARLRNASRITDDVFAAAFRQLAPGMTELELGYVFSQCFVRAGAGPFPGNPMVAFGTGTADVHHIPGQYQLKAGDPVMVDTGMQIGGYYSDMTRTVFFGNADDEMRRVYDVVLEANAQGILAAVPGNTLQQVHAAAMQVISKAGYGEYFTHQTSHGIGIDYHEEPMCADTPIVLKPGMCFSVEPGIYLPGRFGVRIEDLVALTEKGPEVLTHAPKNIMVTPVPA